MPSALTVNAANSSCAIDVAMLFAVHVIELTTSSIDPLSVWIGVGSFCDLIVKCQPGIACTDTDAIASGGGGNTICTRLVRAPADSLGTMNEMVAVPPLGTLGGSMVTCAAAGAAHARTRAPTVAARITRRGMRAVYRMLMVVCTAASSFFVLYARTTSVHFPENGMLKLVFRKWLGPARSSGTSIGAIPFDGRLIVAVALVM